MNKEQLIGVILPKNPEVDTIIDLIETGAFGVSLESIMDSERENIWDMDDYTIVEYFNDNDHWDDGITHIGDSFIESMRVFICEKIDLRDCIEREQCMYDDVIYQTLEHMDMDELIELAEQLYIEVN